MDPSVDEAALALGCWFWGCVGGSKWDSLYSLLFFKRKYSQEFFMIKS